MKKRLIASLLCLCMLVTLFPANVFAADGASSYRLEPTLKVATYKFMVDGVEQTAWTQGVQNGQT